MTGDATAIPVIFGCSQVFVMPGSRTDRNEQATDQNWLGTFHGFCQWLPILSLYRKTRWHKTVNNQKNIKWLDK
jgi:hypothetical protein